MLLRSLFALKLHFLNFRYVSALFNQWPKAPFTWHILLAFCSAAKKRASELCDTVHTFSTHFQTRFEGLQVSINSFRYSENCHIWRKCLQNTLQYVAASCSARNCSKHLQRCYVWMFPFIRSLRCKMHNGNASVVL